MLDLMVFGCVDSFRVGADHVGIPEFSTDKYRIYPGTLEV